MRTLIFGANGMLGHQLFRAFRETSTETYGTIRGGRRDPRLAGIPLLQGNDVLEGVEVGHLHSLQGAFRLARPDLVVNCVGWIKQRKEITGAGDGVNEHFPHVLADLCREAGARMIHFSTDCVFDGRRGNYSESDPPDAEDVYGRGKARGEPRGTHVLTLRTSFIGRELTGSASLLEWFLEQEGGVVSGYRNAWFSGVTTRWIARAVRQVAVDHPRHSGLFHVAGEKISKHDLLMAVREAFGLKVEIVPTDDPRIDRSLDGSRFRSLTGLTPLSWAELLRDLREDPLPYPDRRMTR